METSLPIAEARKRFTHLPDEFAREPGLTIQVTRHGTPVMAVMSWDVYESIVETLEIMSDPETLAALRKGIEQIARGEFIDLETVEAELGLR